MNSLKQFLKGGIFLVVCMMVFGFSNNIVFAEIKTQIECKASNGKCISTLGGQSCSGFSWDQIGICDDAIVVCCKEKGSSVPTTGSGTSSGTAASLNYTPLENLPGFEGESGDFATYFKNLYLLALWIVGISALFMLVVGGFLYLSSAGNTSLVGYAKKTIYGALIGLVIALISWLLLDTINSDLTNLKLSGLSGAVGTSGTSGGGGGSSSGGNIPEEYKGKGSGCSGIPTQPGIDKQCGDASQNLSDVLKCMADKLGVNNIELSSISDEAGFSKCQNEYKKPPCHHTENSCHYGGHNKNPKSCAADISTRGSSASDSSIVEAAKDKCGAEKANNEGNHIHVSVSGCTCDGHN